MQQNGEIGDHRLDPEYYNTPIPTNGTNVLCYKWLLAFELFFSYEILFFFTVLFVIDIFEIFFIRNFISSDLKVFLVEVSAINWIICNSISLSLSLSLIPSLSSSSSFSLSLTHSLSLSLYSTPNY